MDDLNYNEPEKSRITANSTFKRFGTYVKILALFTLLLGVAFLRKRNKTVERVAYSSTIDTVQLNSFNQRAK